MTEYFGNRRTSADTSFRTATNGTNNQRANIFGPFPQNGWATYMGVWGGRVTSNPTVRLAIWRVEDKTDVTLRMGYTTDFNPSVLMTSASGGASYTAQLAHSNLSYSPSDAAVKLVAGEYYAIGFLSRDFDFALAVNTDDQKSLYQASVGGATPTSPFAATSTSTSAEQDIWIVYEPNTIPSQPATGTMTPSGGISTQTPTMHANFVDADTIYGDSMYSYRIQVREVGTVGNLLLNQTFLATTAEQSANQISQVYAGSTLNAGHNYEWRVQVTDQHGDTSPYSNWVGFNINTGIGTVNIPVGATPNGKQNALNGYTFTGQWTHGSALTMNFVTVEIRHLGVVVQRKEYDIANVSSSTAPGTSFNVTFAQLGFTDLTFGGHYSWRMKGKDSAGIYSEYSSETEFTTNVKPNKPSGVSPSQSVSLASPPVLKMTSNDDDDTPVATGGLLSASCRIYNIPVIPNALLLTSTAGWVISNSGDNAGATAAFTVDTSDFSGDGWGLPATGKFTISASTAAGGIVYHNDLTAVWFPCVVGETYAVEGVYRTTDVNVQAEIYIKWYDAARAFLSQSTQVSFTPRLYTVAENKMTKSAAAPANAVFYQIGVRYRTITSNLLGSVYFKNIGVSVPAVRTSRSMVWNAVTSRWNYQTVDGTDDVQTITKTGTVTGGTWGFTFNGFTQTLIPYNISAATLQSTLEAFPTIGTGNVIVTGTGSPTWTLTFAEQLSATYQNVGSVSSALTGTTPGINIVHTTSGVTNDVGPTGKYWWDSISTDTINLSDRSELEAFYFVTGPTVAITSHTDGQVITTSRPTIAWTAASQLRYRVVVYQENTSTIFYDTGTITSALQSFQLPVGTLRNNTNYDIQVIVTNTSGIVGQSPLITLVVSMSAQPALAFNVTSRFVGFDDTESANTLSWEQSAVAPSLFVQYVIGRRITGSNIETEEIIRTIDRIDQNYYVDYFPASGVDYTYSLRQATVATPTSDTIVESPSSYGSNTVTFYAIVLASTLYGGSRRAVLRYVSDRSADHTRTQTVLSTWGNKAPVIIQDSTNYQKVTGTFDIVADKQGTVNDYILAMRNIWDNGDVCCFRDERGRKLFGLLSKFTERDVEFNRATVELEFTEVDFTEGES